MPVADHTQVGRSASLRTIFSALASGHARGLLPLLGLMVVGAAAELLTIGAIIPFLALLSNSQNATELTSWMSFFGVSGAEASAQNVRWAILLLILFGVAAACLRLLILWQSQKYTIAISHQLARRVFGRMLRQPYGDYLMRNSSELLGSLERLQFLAHGVMVPVMQAVVGAVIGAAILGLLLLINPVIVGATFGVLALLYWMFATVAKRQLWNRSAVILRSTRQRVKTAQEALGGYRDVILHDCQPVFEDQFRRYDLAGRRAQAAVSFASAAPRYMIEALGIAAMGVIAIAIGGSPGGMLAALPILGAIALGAQRLLPVIQQIYAGIGSLAANRELISDMLAWLETPIVTSAPVGAALPFNEAIRFQNVSFSFPKKRQPVLQEVNFLIPKGACVGIVGKTGSGKSTLLDLLMGLLLADNGRVTVDGTPLDERTAPLWQRRISHVPQSVYLLDAGIAENIAFGERAEAIDMVRVRAAADRAQIDKFILSLPQGYETNVGERGVKISGGQRQRIALARALYRNPSLLVLDEATSALDDEMQSKVILQIATRDPELTVVIAAHRPEALTECDMILRLGDGCQLSCEEYKACNA